MCRQVADAKHFDTSLGNDMIVLNRAAANSDCAHQDAILVYDW
jgi:hypothetical protein